jgi:hypothetical protein
MDDLSPEPANLRWLRRLVTVLMVVMILGITLIVGLLFLRVNGVSTPADGLTLPDTIALPDGERALAVTAGDGWSAVVTETQRILVFDAQSGALRQTVEIDRR